MNKEDLKIEFRGVPFSNTHILEYRISPDQDITYTKEVSLLWGLIKFTRTYKYDTTWHEIKIFKCWSTSYYYPITDDFHQSWIFLHNQSELDWLKNNFHTLKEFDNYIAEWNLKEREKYTKEREKYLNSQKIMY